MENQMSNQQPMTTQVGLKDVTPISVLMRQSWDLMLKKMGSLFLLVVSYVVVSILGLGLIGVVAFGMYMGGLLDVNAFFSDPTALLSISLLVCIAILYMVVVWSVYSIAGILIVADKEKKPLKEYVKASFPLIIPLSIAALLVNILQTGGFFLLIIPALLIMLTFIFVNFVLVCERLTPYAALKRSHALFSQRFGSLFLRILMLWVVQMVIVYFIPSLFEGKDGQSTGAGLFSTLLSYGMGIYTTCYIYLLYQDAVRVYDAQRPAPFFWQPIAAVVGWVIGVLAIVGLGVTLFNNQDMIRKSVENIVNQLENEGKKNERFPGILPGKDDEFVPPPGFKNDSQI